MEDYFYKIIEIYSKSDVSSSSQDEFYHWLANEKFTKEKEEALLQFWNQIVDSKPEGISSQTHHSLRVVRKKIRNLQGNNVTKFIRFWQISAAVLFLAFLSSLYFLFNEIPSNHDIIEQYVPIAKMSQITLPDGTKVQLNSTSTLLYPEQFTGNTRSVYLSGEAHFKVAKNEKQPFVVKSDDFQVTALGTEFNMSVYPDDPTLSTTLLSGSVEVKFNNLSSAYILKPSEQFTYNKHTKKETVTHPEIDDVTAWQRGELVFRSATLGEIITVLERKYPNSFVYSLNTLTDDKYTFHFKDKTPLKEIMDIIVEVSGNIKYRAKDDKYYISPR